MEINMIKYYAAVDIGGSSGRVILAHLDGGRIVCEEMHRFDNNLLRRDGFLVWDTEALFAEIKAGLKICGEAGKAPVSVAVDMWGVDYVLLDKDGAIVGHAVSNRDPRPEGMDAVVAEKLSEREMYEIAGIQKMTLNTVYQLAATAKKDPEWLERATDFVMLPDYMTYLLTGNIACEYTNASTTSMMDARTHEWSERILDAAGVDPKIMPKIVMPGTPAGNLRPEIADEVGFDCKVVYAATHDTGSAVVSVTEKDCIYISSGTWSLVGVELDEPNTSEEARARNFTNEGGYGGKIRFLKNIIGLWFVQTIRRELGKVHTYPELSAMAREYDATKHRIDVYADRFLAPDSMIDEIRNACGEPDMPIGEVLATVYHSLAENYAKVFALVDEIAKRHVPTVCIIGGGSRDTYLNELTERYSGRRVVRGVVEATAMGNIAVQLIADGAVASLDEARAIIAKSE